MVVAVSRYLERTRSKLRALGYEVVTYGQYPYPIDALVYAGKADFSSFNNSTGNGGILMVNAEGKTIGELDQILKRKVYSPLF